MKKISKIYYIPFDGGSNFYNAAYSYFNKTSKNILIEHLSSNYDLLRLPLGSTVIVEAISSISWHFFLRIDLKILHLPRGGASLKIGWKTLRRDKWHIKIRLKRRDYVSYRNKFIGRYYALEEGTSNTKLLIGPEVTDQYLLNIPFDKDAVHISLSECWSGSEIISFLKNIINNDGYKNKNIFISIHPAVVINESEKSFLNRYIRDFGADFIPGIFITDCVSTVFIADYLKINIKIVKDRQTHDRELFIPQDSMFSISKLDFYRLNNSQFQLADYISQSSPLIQTDQSNTFLDNIKEVLL